MNEQATPEVRVRMSTRKKTGLLVGGVIGLMIIGLTIYARPKTFSYGGNNCFTDFTLLPQLPRSAGSAYYQVYPDSIKKLFGLSVLSTKTCIKPLKAPKPGSTQRVGLRFLGVPMSGKQFSVTVPALPTLKIQSHKGKISIREAVTVQLNRADSVLKYTISGNGRSAGCRPIGSQLTCDIKALNLAQNSRYHLQIRRSFAGEYMGTAVAQTLQTTDPVTITASSVSSGATIYHNPTEFTIDTTKVLTKADVVLEQIGEGNKVTTVPLITTVKGQGIIVKLQKPLARRLAFKLRVLDVVSIDKGVLLEPQVYDFTTSGGPKVTAASIGSRSVEPTKAIVIAFDQALQADQEVASKISVIVAGSAAPVRATISGERLIITPSTNWGLCTSFTIKLTGDMVSAHGFSGDSAWQLNSRTICYSVSAIGYSAQGRAILAWRFGSGPRKILYVGATHGDEQSTKYLMDEWIRELDSNPTKIPADKTLIIVPMVNPDGFAANQRQNARIVDLNRNFPANDWKSDVTMPGGGGSVMGGGGIAPLSEPESQALSNLIAAERPGLVLTYHSIASIVSGNDYGTSNDLAQAYAQISGYRYLPNADTSSVFLYDTTGSFEAWLHDKVGIACLLIELSSSSNSQFSRNKAALWHMVGQ